MHSMGNAFYFEIKNSIRLETWLFSIHGPSETDFGANNPSTCCVRPYHFIKIYLKRFSGINPTI